MSLRLDNLSVNFGQATGDEIIIATTNSLKKDDIEIIFNEIDTGWQAKARIDEVCDNMIQFYSPSYRDSEIISNFKVDVHLLRASDGEKSNVLPFTFVPSLTNTSPGHSDESTKVTKITDSARSVEYSVKYDRKLHSKFSSNSPTDHSSSTTNVHQTKYRRMQEDISPNPLHESVFQMSRFDSDVRSRQGSMEGDMSTSSVDLDCFLEMPPKDVTKFCITSKSLMVLESQDSVSSGYSSGALSSPDPCVMQQHITESFPKFRRIIPETVVDSAGASLKLENTGVQLIVPPFSIPENDVANVGLSLDRKMSSFPKGAGSDGCIAPIVTCLPNHCKFNFPVMIVFPHCAKFSSETQYSNIKLYKSNTGPDDEKVWNKIDYNQQDASSPILFFKNQYAYLYVNHFTDYTITLPSGETCQAKFMTIAVYANELYNYGTNHDVRIYIYGERDDNKKQVEDGEKNINGKMQMFKAKYELLNISNGTVNIFIEYENGWLMKSSKKEKLITNLWRKDYGSCQYTFENKADKNKFFGRISIHQFGSDDEEIEFTNEVKQLEDTETLRGPSLSTKEPFYKPPNCSSASPDSGITSFFSQTSVQETTMCTTTSEQHIVLRHYSHDAYPEPNHNILKLKYKVHYNLAIQLSVLLDPYHPTGYDWRMFAENLGLGYMITYMESREKNPTKMLLSYWESTDEPIEKLIDHMNDIKRPDAARLIEDYISEMNSKRLPQEEQATILDDSNDVVNMSTSSSSSSLATPDKVFGRPNLFHLPSSVFDEDDNNISG